MFVSCCRRYYSTTDISFIYILTDDDFTYNIDRQVLIETLEIHKNTGHICEVSLLVFSQYRKRELDIAKNLAKTALWFMKDYGYSLENIRNDQDRLLPSYIGNWKLYANKIDTYINTIKLLG